MDLALQNISKAFGAGKVLDGVDFSVSGGEICALLGENGAGKTTLMNIVGGVYAADSGELLINGKSVRFGSPAESIAAGIAFIHQDMNLVNDLTVYENLFLGGFLKRGPVLDTKAMITEAHRILGSLGLEIDPSLPLGELDVAHQQLTAIAKALLGNASLIIMDEPTTALTQNETERLFAIMRSLKQNGISIIFISHKLREIMEICDSYAVLRGGKTVSRGSTADTTAAQLAADMVGHSILPQKAIRHREYGETVLTLEKLSDGKKFNNISLSVRAGEILGVTGLSGDGRSEVFETVFGIHGRHYTGTVTVNGKKLHPRSPYSAIKYGLAYLPKNRKENAIASDMSVLDNGTLATLKRYSRAGVISAKKQKKDFSAQKERLNIKMQDYQSAITALSGGNQQKTILARWLLSMPRVLILDNPTQGVDIGAKEEIHSLIEELAENGIAIVVLSADAQEIIRLCERCVVMYRGEITAGISGGEMTEQTIMRLATGAERKPVEE